MPPTEPQHPDLQWDWQTAPRRSHCGLRDKPFLEIEFRWAGIGTILGGVLGPVSVIFTDGPFFWDGVTAWAGTSLGTGVVFILIAKFGTWCRYGFRPKPPDGWCRCGDGA